MEELKVVDSGNRTEWGTSGKRDMGSKGRCDLLPWDVVAGFYLDGSKEYLFCCTMYDATHHVDLKESVDALIDLAAELLFKDKETAMLEVAFQYEIGAKKYGDPRNWELGLPLDIYLDSAGRHMLKVWRSDKDERHDRAVMWNLIGAAWTIKHRPDMIDVNISNPVKTN